MIKYTVKNVGFYTDNSRNLDFDDGYLYITNLRLLWMNDQNQSGIYIDMDRLELLGSSNAFLRQSAKLQLRVAPIPYEVQVLEWNCNICGHHNTKSVCELCGFKPKDLVNAQSPSLGPPVEIKLSLRAGGLQETLKALKQALEDQDWKQTTVDTPVSIKGGVSGVMNSIAALNEKTGNDLQDAFADLDSLMDKALEMVKLAESLRSKVGDRGELETLFLELGISQPVTKEATGDLYHQELAKQLADFLGPLFEKLKMQMMSLTDIYCFYNRARGVSLVSPEDLHRATLEFEKLGLPYVLYEFESGLKAVQSKSLDKDEQTTKILNLMSQDSGLTAVSLAKKLQMSIALSQELLNVDWLIIDAGEEWLGV